MERALRIDEVRDASEHASGPRRRRVADPVVAVDVDQARESPAVLVEVVGGRRCGDLERVEPFVAPRLDGHPCRNRNRSGRMVDGVEVEVEVHDTTCAERSWHEDQHLAGGRARRGGDELHRHGNGHRLALRVHPDEMQRIGSERCCFTLPGKQCGEVDRNRGDGIGAIHAGAAHGNLGAEASLAVDPRTEGPVASCADVAGVVVVVVVVGGGRRGGGGGLAVRGAHRERHPRLPTRRDERSSPRRHTTSQPQDR